jgi:hypothetical protein
MKFCEKYEVGMLKIIIITIAYTLNKFTIHYHNTIVDDGKLYNFKKKFKIFFFRFLTVETDPSLQ